jgi:endonuclease YncB( thermonuclease family)
MTAPEPLHVHPATVIRWIDADTVVLKVQLDYLIAGEPLRHRLLWIDAYEKNTDLGKLAKAYVTNRMPPGTRLIIRSYQDLGEEDNFGRWLAEIFHQGENINQLLLRDGYAVPFMTRK